MKEQKIDIKLKGLSAIDFCRRYLGWLDDQSIIAYTDFLKFKSEGKIFSIQGEGKAYEKMKNKIKYLIEEEER